MKIISNEEPVTDKELKLKDFCREHGLEFEKYNRGITMVDIYKKIKVKKNFFDYLFNTKEGVDIPFRENRERIGNISINMKGFYINEDIGLFLKFVNMYEKIYEVEIEVSI